MQYEFHLVEYRVNLEPKYEPYQTAYPMDQHIYRVINQKETLNDKPEQYEQIVDNNIKGLKQYFHHKAEFKTHFDIRFQLSESMADGTKVGDALEFDNLVVLKPKDSLTLNLKHRQLDSTSTNVKSACTVCGVCTDGRNSLTFVHTVLKPTIHHHYYCNRSAFMSNFQSYFSPLFPASQSGNLTLIVIICVAVSFTFNIEYT